MVVKKSENERAARLVATVPSETWARLELLKDSPRFDGNRSKVVSWAVELLALVLDGQDRVLFQGPADALDEYVSRRLC